MDTEQNLIRRCRWCRERTGQPRYFFRGEWIYVPHQKHLFGDAQFTDGICPECFAHETAKFEMVNTD